MIGSYAATTLIKRSESRAIPLPSNAKELETHYLILPLRPSMRPIIPERLHGLAYGLSTDPSFGGTLTVRQSDRNERWKLSFFDYILDRLYSNHVHAMPVLILENDTDTTTAAARAP